MEMSAAHSKAKDRLKTTRGMAGASSKHKNQATMKTAVQGMDQHHMLSMDVMAGDKAADFVPHKLVAVTNGHRHTADFFSPVHHSPVFPLPPPAPLGPGSPGMIPGSPMIASPPHCSPLHLHPPPSSSSHFHQAPITVQTSFPLAAALPPQPGTASTADPSSPMQVIYSPSQALVRLQNAGNNGSSIFNQQNSTHFTLDSTTHVPGMLISQSLSLQPAAFLPTAPPALHATQYITSTPSAPQGIREYPPPLLTGMQPHTVIGSEFSGCPLPALHRNSDIHTQQYH